MRASNPRIVAVSEPNETRWGYFQFPTLSRFPDGSICAAINFAEDAVEGYGHKAITYISKDNGETWAVDDSNPQISTTPHFQSCEIYDGEFLSVPSKPALKYDSFPEPIAEAFSYSTYYIYRADDFPQSVQDYLNILDAWRWKPDAGQWEKDAVRYNVPNRLFNRYGGDSISTTWFEHAPTKHGKSLYYADYRISCLLDDGHPPKGCVVALMASDDNGKTFNFRSIINAGTTYEPVVSSTAEGNLMCVIREADQVQRPMSMQISKDDGYTWSKPEKLFDFGVFPDLKLMGNGALLMSFGRPGVWAAVSHDGEGKNWTEPICLLEGNEEKLYEDTCGYTSLLPISDNEALIIYSNFKSSDSTGAQRKSIEVRTITL